MKTKLNKITTKRFVIRKSLIGKNVVITFTNKKGKEITYNHDKVFNIMKDKLEAMACWAKYKSYTASNNLPLAVRNEDID